MQEPTSGTVTRVGRRLAGLAAVGVLAVVAPSACSSSSARPHAGPPVATFDDQGGQPQPCMTHQKKQPTSAYRAGDTAVSELELRMLGYYTANGDKPYCDGRPPDATDRTWLTLYLQDGAEPVHVRRYVHPH